MVRSIGRGIWEVIVFVMALVWLFPLFVTFLNAMKSSHDFVMGYFWQMPTSFSLWSNIAYAWNDGGLGSGVVNSLLYGLIGSFFAIAIAAIAAYALVALNVRAKLFWFLLIYSGTVFPFQIYLIPLFRMFNTFRLYDTHLGLDLFYTAVCIPFCLFVLRNYFTTISSEIPEAARLDGCSEFGVFWRMFIPLAMVPAAVLFLFQFTWVWNDLLFGMTLSTSQSVRPVMVGMAGMQGVYAGTNLPAVLAGAIVTSLPTLVLFFILRKHFMQGLSFISN